MRTWIDLQCAFASYNEIINYRKAASLTYTNKNAKQYGVTGSGKLTLNNIINNIILINFNVVRPLSAQHV